MGRQDRSKRAQDPLETAQKPPKTIKRRAQELPRAAQDPPKTVQEPPQEPSWDGLGAILGPSDHKIEKRSLQVNGRQGLGVDFGSQNGSKTTPRRPQIETNIKMKSASLFYRSWIRLGAILGTSWGHVWQFRIGFSNTF